MRKFLVSFLAALACALTIAAVGCQTDSGKGSPKNYTVTFTPTDNLEYICDGLADGENTLTVKSGTTVKFSVEVPTLYAVPTVYANGSVITAENGDYSVVVKSNVTISTGVVGMPAPTLGNGSGTDNSPFLISTPSDYFYIAQMINAGNLTFVTAYYALDNDIDFNGAEIPVIGDGSTATSYFMGNFNGNGHTLSNFKINTYGVPYVGIFGYLVSSGTGDDSGVVANLNIDNFDISAQASDLQSLFVGSLVGYSMAANVIACNATNGSIWVDADASNAAFSYIGGAVGVQASAIITDGTQISYYPALTGYVMTDVSFDGRGGIYTTGGVVGYVVSENERSISSVVNCYALGDVSGGIYSGGVVGNLSDYSAMVNCYSLSEVVYSYSRYSSDNIYSHSYAGGLAGCIGNGAIITDSFAKNDLIDGYSPLGANYVHTGEIVGGVAEATAISEAGIILNCYSGNDVKTTEDFFKSTLYWQECDWKFSNGSYPVINPEEEQANQFTVTFNYLDNEVEGYDDEVEGEYIKDLTITLSDAFYSPLFYFYGEEFSDIVVSVDGKTSYGYFFDKSLTLKVPYGFTPTRDITLYTGFSDYNEVAGEYYLVPHNSKRAVKLTLDSNGSYTYNDGVEFTDFYTYDSENNKLIFSNTLFTRLINAIIDDDDNARPDINYSFAKFAGRVVDGVLEIYDGNYVTVDNPLKANRQNLTISGEWYYGSDAYVFYTDNTGRLNNQSFTYTLTSAGVLTISGTGISKTGSVSGNTVIVDGNTLNKYDAFKGVWEISANVSKAYEFDGKGGWTYTLNSVKYSGTYTVGGNGVATLSGDFSAEAQIDASGLLRVNKNGVNEYFKNENGFGGIWVDFENDVYIYIYNDGNSVTGTALIKISGSDSELNYILDGFFDAGSSKSITLLNGYTLFGYLVCNADGTLSATFYSANTSEYFSGYTLYLLDEFEGEWVGEDIIDGTLLETLEFNGLGIYEGKGSVKVNGKNEYTYSLEDILGAIFGDYNLKLDVAEDVITLSNETETAHLYRKDEISSYVLVSNGGIKFTFNGGGDLSKGGKLTVTGVDGTVIVVLGYKNVSGSVAELNLVIELYSQFQGSETVGEITINNYKFEFKYDGEYDELKPDGEDEEELDCLILTIDNPFTGTWSASDFSTNIYIGKLDLSNTLDGSFLDMPVSVLVPPFTYLPEYNCLLVSYITGEMTSPTDLYLIMLSEGNMVISSYNVLTAGDYLIYCARDDGFYGSWTNNVNSQKSIRFDGMGDSLYTVGIARNESNEVFLYTRRFGTVYYWSEDGENAYTIEKSRTAKGENVYTKSEYNRIVFNDFDLSSCILSVANGKYKFYLTHVEVDGVEKEYMLTRVNGDITELVIYENKEDATGVRYIINHTEKTIEQAD